MNLLTPQSIAAMYTPKGIKPPQWFRQMYGDAFPEMTAAPELWWYFSDFFLPVWEGSGRPRDIISQGYGAGYTPKGTLVPAEWQKSKVGLARRYFGQGTNNGDGEADSWGDVLDVGTQDFTAFVFYQHTGNSSNINVPFSKFRSGGQGPGWSFQVNNFGSDDHVLKAVVGDGGGTVAVSSSSNFVVDGEPIAAVMTRQGTTLKLFAEGEEIGSTTNIRVGNSLDTNTDLLTGSMSDSSSNEGDFHANGYVISAGLGIGKIMNETMAKRLTRNPFAILRPALV